MNMQKQSRFIPALLMSAMLAASVAGCRDDNDTAANGSTAFTTPITPAAAPAPAPAAPAPKPAPTHVASTTHYTPKPAEPVPVCYDCGTIVAIDPVKVEGKGSGAGAVAGAAAGAVAGHQVGQGRGRDMGSIIGAVAGAVAGHQIEKQIRSSTVYRVSVRMDDASSRSIDLASADGVSVGQKVRVSGATIIPR